MVLSKNGAPIKQGRLPAESPHLRPTTAGRLSASISPGPEWSGFLWHFLASDAMSELFSKPYLFCSVAFRCPTRCIGCSGRLYCIVLSSICLFLWGTRLLRRLWYWTNLRIEKYSQRELGACWHRSIALRSKIWPKQETATKPSIDTNNN